MRPDVRNRGDDIRLISARSATPREMTQSRELLGLEYKGHFSGD